MISRHKPSPYGFHNEGLFAGKMYQYNFYIKKFFNQFLLNCVSSKLEINNLIIFNFFQENQSFGFKSHYNKIGFLG
jgi:hypothetical protein